MQYDTPYKALDHRLNQLFATVSHISPDQLLALKGHIPDKAEDALVAAKGLNYRAPGMTLEQIRESNRTADGKVFGMIRLIGPQMKEFLNGAPQLLNTSVEHPDKAAAQLQKFFNEPQVKTALEGKQPHPSVPAVKKDSGHRPWGWLAAIGGGTLAAVSALGYGARRLIRRRKSKRTQTAAPADSANPSSA
jgi:hypothetical protein